MLTLAAVLAMGSAATPTAGASDYAYDTAAHEVAVTHAAAASAHTATTPTVGPRSDARGARHSPRTSPGVVHLASGFVRAAKARRDLPEVNWGAQEKHFLGHNTYIQGRSQLSADPRKLIQRAGSGEPVGSIPRGQPGFKERIDFGETIGTYVNPKTGVEVPSSRGILIYSKRGVHIYPVRPR